MATPPGWYDDGSGRYRWWDGAGWGEYAPAQPTAGQPSPGAGRSTSRRGMWVGVVAATLALVLLAGGGWAAYLSIKPDRTPPPGADSHPGDSTSGEPVAATFADGLSPLTEPADRFVLEASHISLSAELFLNLELHGEGGHGSPVMIGDIAVVAVADYHAPHLAGVDARTAQVLWTRELDGVPGGCRPLLPERNVVCHVGNDVQLFAVDTGEVMAHLPLGDRWVRYDVAEDALYVASYPGAETHVRKMDRGDLTVQWERRHAATWPVDCDDAGLVAGPAASVLVWLCDGYWLLDTASGDVLATASHGEEALTLSGHHLVFDGQETEARDVRGRPLWRAEGRWWWGGSPPGKVGIGAGVYDITSGAELWSAPALDHFSWSDGGRLVVASVRHGNGYRYLDAESGETVADFSDGGWGELVGNAWLAIESDAVVVRDAMGGIGWTAGLSGQDVEAMGANLAVGDSTLVLTSETALTVFAGFGAEPSVGADGDDASYATSCGSEPEFRPVRSAADERGVAVTFEVVATCPGGHWLAHDRYSVQFVAYGQLWASGLFDFSRDPYWLSDASSTVTLVFGYDTIYATADEIQEAIAADGRSGNVIQVPCEPDSASTIARIPADPVGGAEGETLSADGGAEAPEVVEESARQALQRMLGEDADFMGDHLEGRWVAQLSSKKIGMEIEGKVVTHDQILATHVRLRALYPEVRLLHSSDWATFNGEDFWVTVQGGQTYSGWRAPLRWCDAEGWSDDDCFAKRISRTVRHEPATCYRNALRVGRCR